ncbi:IS66 family transposase [Prosthecomicrobium sp. N25]|uniref:IS66 family transposase n=1 Tax=Prosthecomicrobium sp. N25 TaxID=3129254 RepID=UPI003FCD037E
MDRSRAGPPTSGAPRATWTGFESGIAFRPFSDRAASAARTVGGGPSLLAEIVTAKYGTDLPLHRQGERLTREGVSLPDPTLAIGLADAHVPAEAFGATARDPSFAHPSPREACSPGEGECGIITGRWARFSATKHGCQPNPRFRSRRSRTRRVPCCVKSLRKKPEGHFSIRA